MALRQPEGFLAVPRDGKGPGILVLHAWWGLNNTIKDFCTRLADSGFLAFAPDLYHGKIADTIAGAEMLSTELDGDQGKQPSSSSLHSPSRSVPDPGGVAAHDGSDLQRRVYWFLHGFDSRTRGDHMHLHILCRREETFETTRRFRPWSH